MRTCLLAVSVLLSVPVLAQQSAERTAADTTVASAPAVAPARKVVQYISAEGFVMPSAQGADHRRETVYRDSIAGFVREYYPSGKLHTFAPYANLRLRLKHGPATAYSKDGKLTVRQEFVAGKQQGERLMYYPDGILRRHDVFANDVRVSGEYYTADGKPAPYLEAEAMPRYEAGGLAEIVAAVAARVQYPLSARLASVQGKVYVFFIVDTKGKIEDVRVVKSVSPVLDKAALEAVKNLRRFAAPGLQEGVPVKVSFTVPITFRIQ